LGYVPREAVDAMMRMSKVEAQALAAFVGRIRPDWQQPGIVAAIEKALPLGSAAAIGAALCKLAENYDLRTPALLAEPGPHWHGTTVASRQPPSMCPDHPGQRAGNCADCAAAADAADHAAGLARVRAALAEAPNPPRTDRPTPPRAPGHAS
jgi:hypothetical protein